MKNQKQIILWHRSLPIDWLIVADLKSGGAENVLRKFALILSQLEFSDKALNLQKTKLN